jgi:uncharacterized protein (DUF2141 family)
LITGCQVKDTSSANIPEVVAEAFTGPAAKDPVDESVPPSRPLKLHIEVNGFPSDQGRGRIAVYASPKHFNDPEHAIARNSFAIAQSKVHWELELDRGELAKLSSSPLRLAISAYHDANDNAKLDKNSFGVPVEAYGFSNAPKREFGPPSFNEVAIVVSELADADPAPIAISIK